MVSILRSRLQWPAFACFALLGASLAAQTTIGTTTLTFDVSGGPNLPQTYGDFVTSQTQGSFSYGGTPPFTPDISVQYVGGVLPDFYLWASAYGDLTNVIYGTGTGTESITLTAQNGAGVQLFGFDLASYLGNPLTVSTLNVRDGAGVILFTQSNVVVPASHAHIGFAPALAGLALKIELVGPSTDFSILGIDNVAIGEFSAGGIGQANSTQAGLRVNALGSTGLHGPFSTNIPIGGTMTMSWNGPPGQPMLLVGAPLNPANLTIPCTGTIDIGTPPSYPNLVVLIDGTLTSFPDSLFHLTPGGTAQQSFTMPSPMTFTMQAAVFQPAGSPCPIVLTAAFTVSIP